VARDNRGKDILVFFLFGNQQTALKLHIQSAQNTVNKPTYEFSTYWKKRVKHRLPAQIVRLPKLVYAETATIRTNLTPLK
jgi:hypothetical protein